MKKVAIPLSIALGSVIIMLALNHRADEEISYFWKGFFGVFAEIFSFFAAAVVAHLLYEVFIKRETQEEILTQLGKYSLRETAPDKAYEQAIDLIQECDEIRVIGTPDTKLPIVQKYLDATSSRIKKNPKIIYKRICDIDCNEIFISHLKEVLYRNEDSSSIRFIDESTFINTYLIIDKKDKNNNYIKSFLLLSLSEGTKNNKTETFRYCSDDETIIKHYRKQFNDFWVTGNYEEIFSANQIEIYTQQKRKFRESVQLINQTFIDLKNNQIKGRDYLLDVLQYEANRITQLKKDEQIIEHDIGQEKLLNTFSSFMGRLRNGDIYKTVSFPEFWKHIEEDAQIVSKASEDNAHYTPPNFLYMNHVALRQGAKIERVIILPQRFWESSDNLNWAQLKDILKSHIDLVKKKINLSGRKNRETINYDFKILILPQEQYKDKLQRKLNSAIIKQEHDKKSEFYAFIPSRENGRIVSTKITKFQKNDSRFEDQLDIIQEEFDRIKTQKITLEEWKYIQEIAPDFFNDNALKDINQRKYLEEILGPVFYEWKND